MPSHGPKEPPDDDHGWEAEYDGLMATEEGQALLNGLWRLSSDAPDIGGHRTDLNDADAVETDDYALQAFVWMVYDRGIAYGYGQAREEQGHAALAEELAKQDRTMDDEPTPRPEHLRVNDSTCSCGDPECKLGEGWYF